MLHGLKVVELSRDIPASYCGKLFADAGAEVILAEPVEGHPLRSWKTADAATDGLLFDYLAAGKGAVSGCPDSGAVRELIENADVVVDDLGPGVFAAAQWSERRPELVVTSITPFGCSGPWRDRPATEAVVQAWAGSTGRRGRPGRAPVMAGNQISDWLGGTYAAAVTLAVALSARTTGVGGHIDFSLLECAAVNMDPYSVVTKSMRVDGIDPRDGRPPQPRIPSVEPTSDGLVGFFPNTAQQWHDFLIMIGRPDYADDASLRLLDERLLRADELLAVIRSWTMNHTTAEVLDLARAFRLPVAPIGNGRDVLGFNHLVERGVFEESPSGAIRPRVPYSVSDQRRTAWASPPPRAAAPATFRAEGPAPHIPALERRVSEGANADEPSLPLTGLKVLDFTAFWSGPACTNVLASLGADVIKIEAIQRPDGMRQNSARPTDDLWYEWAGTFQSVNMNKRGITLNLATQEGVAIAKDLIRWADVIVENFTPRVMDSFGLGWDAIHAMNPEATMLRIPAFGLTGEWREFVGFAMTVEQSSGLTHITGYPDDLPLDMDGVCDPIGGMHALFALLASLAVTGDNAVGRLVEAPLMESALNVAAEQVIQYTENGTLLTRQGNRTYDSAPQGVYRSSNAWVLISVATDAQWAELRTLVRGELSDHPLATVAERRVRHDWLDELLSAWCAEQDGPTLVEKLAARGVPAALVGGPPDIAENPHLLARGFFESVDHPVTGRRDYPSLPFRLSTWPHGWYRTHAPVLGQHNIEVLTDVVGLSDTQIAELQESEVIGTALA